MRALILLAAHCSIPAAACPDLGGKFVDASGEFDVDFVFEQRSCASATTRVIEAGEYETKVERYFDGQLRVTWEQDGTVYKESELWDGETMLTLEDYFWKYSNARMQIRGTYWLDEGRNLRVQKVVFEGGKETSRYNFFYRRK